MGSLQGGQDVIWIWVTDLGNDMGQRYGKQYGLPYLVTAGGISCGTIGEPSRRAGLRPVMGLPVTMV